MSRYERAARICEDAAKKHAKAAEKSFQNAAFSDYNTEIACAETLQAVAAKIRRLRK